MANRVSIVGMSLVVIGSLFDHPSCCGDDGRFAQITSYVNSYCLKCHQGQEARGELDLQAYQSAADVTDHFRRWNNILSLVRSGEMPPSDAKAQPEIEQSNRFIANVEAILTQAARRSAGDPGVVLPRRLNNTEYNLVVAQLTGVPIDAAANFPPDPAGGEGFDNTGEALAISPSRVTKYLAGAQTVADHLVLKPTGIQFAPFAVRSYNERRKLTEQAILEFYQRHDVDIAEYVRAAWQYRDRSDERLSVSQWATQNDLSIKYLTLVWELFSNRSGDQISTPLRARWDSLPDANVAGQQSPEFKRLMGFIQFVQNVLCPQRKPLIKSNAGNWPILHLDFRSKTAAARDKFDRSRLTDHAVISSGQVPRVTDKQTEDIVLKLRVDTGFTDEGGLVIIKRPLFSTNRNLPSNPQDEERHKVQPLRDVLRSIAPQQLEQLQFGQHPMAGTIDEQWLVVQAPAEISIRLTREMQKELEGKHLLWPCYLDPDHASQASVLLRAGGASLEPERFHKDAVHLAFADSPLAEQLEAAAEPICRAFPNRFYYVDAKRGLAAGFHLVEGFFRDDLPLVRSVLSQQETEEIDRLWNDLDFVCNTAETLLRGFVWFERSERHVLHDERFAFLRPEDPRLVENELLDRFEKLYLDRNGIRRVDDTLEAENPNDKYRMIRGFFKSIRDGLALRREQLKTAEKKGLEDLIAFAQRSFRGQLSDQQKVKLRELYDRLRTERQPVEDALRGVTVAVLMSPDFLIRYAKRAGGERVYALSDIDLAQRLSFFLWSTIPDDALMREASAGRLHQPEILTAQTRRMLADPKIKALAREFLGQWLRYRDYMTSDPINAEAFDGYDDQVREAIFQEPHRLAEQLIQENRPVTELLTSDHTFLNQTLAKHYGGELLKRYREVARGAEPSDWIRVDGLGQAGRGGLPGMAIVLATNAAGQRTSPVKRGFWCVHHLLGQHFPPPPADVPELPASEEKAPQSIREMLASHVADEQCARCHRHFDKLGLTMEGFDPIGRSRTRDAAGRPIDNVVSIHKGVEIQGVPGLIAYIQQHRKDEFIDTLCRKLLGYALGRSVALSDQPLLSRMKESLAENEDRFHSLFETVVTSSQFLKARGKDFEPATSNR